jgi:integrase
MTKSLGVSFEVDPADEDYYEPFSSDELRRLMASPVFAAGLRPRRGRGDTAKWAPLLALFQGARRTEVIQLSTSDITQDTDTGVWAMTVKATKGSGRSHLYAALPRLNGYADRSACWSGSHRLKSFKCRSASSGTTRLSPTD